jgi:hypothetical protein
MVAMAATVLGGFSRVGADSRLPGGIRSGVKVGGEVFVHSRRKKQRKKEQDGIDVCLLSKASCVTKLGACGVATEAV